VDISILALEEARQRIGDHGLFVVADIANLPFHTGCFDGAVSLHTIHHLPAEEHPQAYTELVRVLVEDASAVIVNGWTDPPLMKLFGWPMAWAKVLRGGRKKKVEPQMDADQGALARSPSPEGRVEQQRARELLDQAGTFVSKNNAVWLKREVGGRLPQGTALEIWCWRSLSVAFLRSFIHEKLAGRALLRLAFWLEERFPHFLGERGQYPLIVVKRNH
jgi:hypothetical protein